MPSCCEQCFADTHLIELIKREGKTGDCDYCKAEGVCCVSPDLLTDLFKPLVALFKPAERETLYSLPEHICDYWNVFSETLQGGDKEQELLDDIRPHAVGTGGLLTFFDEGDEVSSADEWSIKEEYRIYDYWKNFCQSLMHENRFFIPNETTFFEHLSDIGDKAVLEHSQDKLLYRGRIAKSNIDVEIFDTEHMLAPEAQDSVNGRANVQGIPVLYVSEDESTVVAELRGWIGSSISVGTLEPVRELRLVDLTNHDCYGSPFLSPDITATFIRLQMMRKLDTAFSSPLSDSDAQLRYVPTQYVAAFFKANGLDGIRYRSAMHRGGFNIALFDPKGSVKAVSVEYSKVDSIDYKTRQFIPLHKRPGVRLTVAPEPK